jgi:predicted lipoprotein
VESSYAAPDFFDTSLVNVYGLDAIEYLLFNGSPDNSCPQQVPINDGAWDALGETEVTRRRADYAAVAATQVAAVAQTLAQQWDPAGGQYATWFAEPGAGGSPYESEAQALNELMRAMFYVDLRLKDEKLGRPGGIVDCGADVCIDALESQWADRSKEHAVANLRGLKQMFVAGDDPQAAVGFDDFLRAAGEEGLATEIVADIDAAIAALEAMPNSFADALASDGAALDNPHAAVKLVTDTLKGPFAMLLQLRIPDEGAGDAD